MENRKPRKTYLKWSFAVLGSLTVFVLFFAIACRLAVMNILKGMETSRAASLSALAPFREDFLLNNLKSSGGIWISRSAAVEAKTASFETDVATVRRIVSAQNGYFDDLKTETRSGHGRILTASINVPAPQLEDTLRDLKSLGRVERISEASENTDVKLGKSERHTLSAKRALARLETLRKGRSMKPADAIALQKEIRTASQELSAAQSEQEQLLSTVARALIQFALVEEYKSSVQLNFSESLFSLRNSLAGGITAIFASASAVLGMLFEFGLPLLFWFLLLYWPGKFVWGRLRVKFAAS